MPVQPQAPVTYYYLYAIPMTAVDNSGQVKAGNLPVPPQGYYMTPPVQGQAPVVPAVPAPAVPAAPAPAAPQAPAAPVPAPSVPAAAPAMPTTAQ